MNKINDLIQQVVKQSESVDGFYEVEVSVLIRTDGGAKSNFIRAQSHWTPENSDWPDSDTNEDNPFKWM